MRIVGEELMGATGMHPGSLYQALGSKRGLFIICLRNQLSTHTASEATA